MGCSPQRTASPGELNLLQESKLENLPQCCQEDVRKMGIIKSELDSDKDLLVRHATGEISAEDIKEVIESYYSDASVHIASKVLWDLREATFNQITSRDVSDIGKFAAKHTGPRKGIFFRSGFWPGAHV